MIATFASMSKITVKIINESANPLPAYATAGSAGMDLMAHMETAVTLGPLERHLIPTGLFIELPEGYEAQIRPRSGLAAKHGLTVLNSPGTIDSDYRGEIKIILVNLSNQPQTIRPGERIAQMVIGKVEQIAWEAVKEIAVTARNQGGFGHTGK
jgi:dUTP pyrophosphatase